MQLLSINQGSSSLFSLTCLFVENMSLFKKSIFFISKRQTVTGTSYKIDYFNPLILQIGDLKLNTIKRHVLKDNKPVHLTLVEFNLLKLLMNKAGEILTRVTILDCIWGCTAYRYVDTRVVDVYISRLRSKLGQDSSAPNLILTIRGEGYKFQNVKN